MKSRHVVSRYGLEALEQRRLLSAGDLDAGFGVDGRLVDSLPTGPLNYGLVLVLQNDRLLVDVHGSSNSEEIQAEPRRYELRRYTVDGAPDATFGNAGVVVGSLPPECNVLTGSLLEMPDGKIVATGVNGNDQFLVRFNADGSVDTTFDGDGLLRVPWGRYANFDVDPAGRLYVATNGPSTTDPDPEDIGHVYRFLPNGTLDASFGDGGVAVSTNSMYAIEVAADGTVLLAESERFPGDYNLPAVSRLNADGFLDAGFGDGGTVVLPALGVSGTTALAAAVLPDGQILVLTRMAVQRAGGEVTGPAVLRLGDDGAVDPSFNGGSGATFLEGLGHAVVIESDAQGRAIVIGHQGSVRLLPDGAIDPAFGRVATEIPGSIWAGGGVQSDGRLIVGYPLGGRGLLTYGILTDDPAPSPIALDLDTGVLAVSGTDGDDSLDVIERAGSLRAVREGFGRAFDVADVERLSVTGGAGDDAVRLLVQSVPGEVYGGDGRDRITGGAGHDTLYGEGGRDFIDGGLGADLIVGGGGNDQIRGQGGADHLYGYGGNDVIQGNGGNDRIVGGAGADTLFGGAGDDGFIANDGVIDQLFGDAGNDFADADEDDLLASIETTA